jgi:plastocyanin
MKVSGAQYTGRRPPRFEDPLSVEWGIEPLMITMVLLALALGMAASAAPAAADLAGTARAHREPVPDAVVWLDASFPVPQVPHPKPVLDQRDLSFQPRVLAVQLGTTVQFPNHDRVFHDVFSFHDGKRFDLGLYPVGTVRNVLFDRVGLSRIFCNIHPGMSAYVMVVDTPYFAVTDRSGAFVIPGVVPGTYRYHAWRAGAAEDLEGLVTVTAGTSLDVQWP